MSGHQAAVFAGAILDNGPGCAGQSTYEESEWKQWWASQFLIPLLQPAPLQRAKFRPVFVSYNLFL